MMPPFPSPNPHRACGPHPADLFGAVAAVAAPHRPAVSRLLPWRKLSCPWSSPRVVALPVAAAAVAAVKPRLPSTILRPAWNRKTVMPPDRRGTDPHVARSVAPFAGCRAIITRDFVT